MIDAFSARTCLSVFGRTKHLTINRIKTATRATSKIIVSTMKVFKWDVFRTLWSILEFDLPYDVRVLPNS